MRDAIKDAFTRIINLTTGMAILWIGALVVLLSINFVLSRQTPSLAPDPALLSWRGTGGCDIYCYVITVVIMTGSARLAVPFVLLALGLRDLTSNKAEYTLHQRYSDRRDPDRQVD